MGNLNRIRCIDNVTGKIYAVPIDCNKPCWRFIYESYRDLAKNRVIIGDTDNATRVTTAIVTGITKCFSHIVPAQNFGVGNECFIGAEELKEWLLGEDVWRGADAVGKRSDKRVVGKMCGWNGVVIIDRNDGSKYATLWENNNVIDGHIDDSDFVHFWQLEKHNNPYVFSQKEFENYMEYINTNALKPPNDRADCIMTVIYSMRILLDDKKIPSVQKPKMSSQMDKMRELGYAGNTIKINFKDSNGKPTIGITNPANFLEKSLSEIISPFLSSEVGYYFWGISIMAAFHSAMVVVNNTNPANPTFNIYDQRGSLGKRYSTNVKPWYSGVEIDTWLKNIVKDGHPLSDKTKKGVTTTEITPIKHKVLN